MAHYLALEQERLWEKPLILIVPGLNNSNPKHWQSLWEDQRDDCQRVDLGMWEDPHRNTWVNKLNLAIHQANRPIILVAHSLGCLAVAWWAEYEQQQQGNPVIGALLVAPPDVDRPGADPRLARFGACPRNPLPFPSYLAASEDDHYCRLRTSQMLARDWGSRFAYAGAIGHINADSGIGDWHFGQVLLEQLLRDQRRRPKPAQAQRRVNQATPSLMAALA
ncbi:alpha/beta fold hydrolase [Altererythrobacter xixiisoli]|uniref:Alpha/beta fold hydrolase n=1 Tax=Croceibacterium xixiisoli TaxID=1476466 RepID=A0A6I4TUG4_9SPHN|nr:alpha/beta fold hydrolase [Croceibacterium xixiisoli]MXO99706.1 alpha/beta fold hydrolase [Croceibacterium xixiisoli]